MRPGNVQSKIVLPITVAILAVMLLLHGAVILVVKKVSEDHQNFIISAHAAEVEKILETAVSELVMTELLNHPGVVAAKQKATLAEISDYWSRKGLEGTVRRGEQVLLSSPGFEKLTPVLPQALRNHTFQAYHGFSYINGRTTTMPIWGWHVITVTRPIPLHQYNSAIFYLLPAVMAGTAVLYWWIRRILKINLLRPARLVLADIGGERPVAPAGLEEVDHIGEAVNRAMEALKKRNEQLQMLHDINLSLHQEGSLEEILVGMLRKAVRVMGVDHAAIAIFQRPGGELTRLLREGECPAGDGWYPQCTELYTRIMHDGRPITIQDASDDPGYMAIIRDCCTHIRSLIAQPVPSERGWADIVLLFANKRDRFTPEDERLTRTLAADALTAIERFQATEQLRRSEEHYRALAEGAQDSIFELDREFRILYVNRCGAALVGRKQEEMAGLPLDRLFPRDAVRVMKADLERVFRTGESVSTEIKVPLPGGDMWHSTRLVPLAGEKGGTASVLGITRDVTERKRAEEALLLKERAIQTSINGIAMADLEGRLTYVNPALVHLWGYSEEKELLGRSAVEFWQEPAAAAEVIRQLLDKGGWTGELTAVKKDGSPIPVQFSASLVADSRGDPFGLLGVFVDVTERKQTEERTRASLREKEVLLKEIHHRVKNNLQVISGLLNLQAAHLADERTRNVYRESQNRVITMALIHEQLYQSRDLARVEFSGYLRTLAENLLVSYGADSRKISLDIKADPVHLVVDTAIPGALIINELVSNSLKHAFPDGREGKVRVEFAEPEERRYVLTVADDGVGLPQGLDPARSKSLGLRLVIMLTEQLGGKWELSRKGGTTFRISFREYREAGTSLY